MIVSRYGNLSDRALQQVIGWEEERLQKQREGLTALKVELARRSLEKTAELSDAGLGLYIDCLDPETIGDHVELLRKSARLMSKKQLSRRKCTDDNNLLGTCIHAPEDTGHTQCLLCGKPLEDE